MTTVLRFESRKRLRGALWLTLGVGAISLVYIAMFPSLQEDIEAFEGSFPELFNQLFGIDDLSVIEGFVAAEVYHLFWMVLVGIYFAYVAAGSVAGEIQDGRMDLLLSYPVARESVLVQKLASLWVPLVFANVGLITVVGVGAVVIGEPIDPVALTMTHLLSVPYLLVCAGIGLVCSVTIDRPSRAQIVAIALVFISWLLEGVTTLSSGTEWIGNFMPARYYDPTAILVHQEYALLDAGLLLVGFVMLVLVSVCLFVRRDL